MHGGDVGRGLCLDLDSTQAGTEYWQLHSDSIYDCNGKGLYLVNRGNITGYPNFRIFGTAISPMSTLTERRLPNTTLSTMVGRVLPHYGKNIR